MNEVSIEELKKCTVRIEGYYDILENDDNEFLITVKQTDSPIEDGCPPRFYYDGGEHGILLKNNKTVTICDYVNPGVRGRMGKVLSILFAELKDGAIAEEYHAEVINQPGISKIAEELMRRSKINETKGR